MEFYVGLHIPAHAANFDRCMISLSTVRTRRKPIASRRWMLDSGAFTEVARHGGYRAGPEAYAEVINRLGAHGGLVVAVAEDWMCEPFVLDKTGRTVREHQALTIERYLRVRELTPHEVMPVIQGYAPADYAQHVADYGALLRDGAWVGVGSVCKRSGHPARIVAVLDAILSVRPDLRLHGFGVQLRALRHPGVRSLLATADSMAWSFNARRQGRGRDANRWQEAARYVERVEAACERPSSGSAPRYWQAPLSSQVLW